MISFEPSSWHGGYGVGATGLCQYRDTVPRAILRRNGLTASRLGRKDVACPCRPSGGDLLLNRVDEGVGVERLGDEAAGAVGEHGVAGLFLAVADSTMIGTGAMPASPRGGG